MSLWGRKRDALGSAHELAQHAPRASAPHLCRQAAPRGVARATLEGASRLEILREALHELRAAGDAERLGIWMTEASEASEAFSPVESQPPGAIPAREAATKAHASAWRGVAWDAESQSAPREWQQLSAEAPIPQEALLGVRAVAQEFEAHNSSILISILVGMRRALWTPIASRSRVLGVILCASREKGQALPQGAAARLAADLALQLAWQEERAIARARYADLSLARRMHDELNAQGGPDAVLARLADSIVANATSLDAGLGAAFVTIGVLSHSPSVVAPVSTASPAIAGCQAATPAKASVEFLWKSGDPDWIRIAEGTALTETWQEALNTRRTTGMSPQRSWIPTAIARIVAVPILEDGELCGVLLAGLPRREASLAGLERLEYRAMLAGLAIARQQRQRSEAAAARRLRSQVAVSREMLFVLDQDRKVADLSAAAGEILRGVAIAPDEQPNSFSAVIGTPFLHLFRPADRAAVDAWWCSAESCGEQWNPAPDELPAELANGIRVQLRRSLAAVAGPTVVALTTPALQQPASQPSGMEQTLQAVIEWLEEGVALFDAQDRVRVCNARFEQFAGWPAGESAIGATLDELTTRMGAHAADSPAFAERWRALAHGHEGGARDELRMALPTPRILERASRPVLDPAGHRLGRVEVYRDLTAQRVFQAQLLQTEKLAALGQMITGVAHELSNPLTSILGYAQRLLLRENAAASATEVRQIFQEAERASGILRQLLFSARETPPERRRVALNQVVLRSMDLQRFSMSAEKIRVELDLDPALPMILGDSAQLQQVLLNLVGNARQAILQHGHDGWIRVRTRQIAERRVQLTVEDDGPGVPQSILARIFDPFFTTKAAGVGTGLGLSIVLSIVREHGGSVNVLHGAEGGAVFSIELPVAQGSATTPAASPATSEQARALPYAPGCPSPHQPPAIGTSAAAILARTLSAAPLSPLPASHAARVQARVLVVEDEPTVARLIADVLQDEGFLVEVLLDGQKALDRAAQEFYDLVICDMKMPSLDGQHLYQRLAASGNPLRHSFLFVTGDVIAPATQAFLERNALAHLAKPFRVEELTACVHQVLENSPQRTAAAGRLSASAGAGENTVRKSGR